MKRKYVGPAIGLLVAVCLICAIWGLQQNGTGGNEGRENTLSGLEAAWNAGAYGSEIDIQRTKDRYYILNHDSTFKRVAGDSRKPEEMTMREIRKLSIDGEPIPTFEEMLIACRGRMVLFTELKGNTADRKMADDAVSIVKQYQTDAINSIHAEGKSPAMDSK